MKTVFDSHQRAQLQNMDFTFSYDLVGEVAYRLTGPDEYVTVDPDDSVRVVHTSDIESYLGTY